VVLVHRYLVVANQTLGGELLLARIRELAREGPTAFHVVVPATPPSDHVWTEDEAAMIATSRLDSALERMTGLGLDADGEVGDGSPMLAIEDAIREQGPFEAIVLSTLPPRLSRWLRLDLPHRVESAFGLRVIHVVGEPDGVGSPRN
jgi:hypothetical protein